MEAVSYSPKYQTSNVLTVTLRGNVDGTIVYELTRAMLDDRSSHIELCFELQRNYRITDTGIVLLMMFLSRARRKKIQVMFTLVINGMTKVIASPPDDYYSIRNLLSPRKTPPIINSNHFIQNCTLQ